MSERRIVVMGVSGSGKSTLGPALARELEVPFLDGDALHSSDNVAKMAAGHALDDADREPWLRLVGRWLAGVDAGVIACSALRRRYRDLIRAESPDAFFVHLSADPQLIIGRQRRRVGHFMSPELMTSQLETLEPLQPDERGVVVDVSGSPDDALAQALASVR